LTLAILAEAGALPEDERLDHIKRRISELPRHIRDPVSVLVFEIERLSAIKRGGRSVSKRAQQLIAFACGAVLIVGMLVIAFLAPSPTPFQYTIFRVVLALAAAGIAAMIPGFIELEIKAWLRAGGALAVFVIVYFYNPAALVTTQP
jgi:hypothetical protein